MSSNTNPTPNPTPTPTPGTATTTIITTTTITTQTTQTTPPAPTSTTAPTTAAIEQFLAHHRIISYDRNLGLHVWHSPNPRTTHVFTLPTGMAQGLIVWIRAKINDEGVRDVNQITEAQRAEVRSEVDRVVEAFYGRAAMITFGSG